MPYTRDENAVPPSDDDLVVTSAPEGYAIRRVGSREVMVEGPFTVFGSAINAARTHASSEAVAVWLQSGAELHLVCPRPDVPAPAERRQHRLVLPPCPTCGVADALAVVSRTPFVVYVRCALCGSVWSEAKPGQPFLSDPAALSE